jgi:hypothetical protein
MVRRGLLALFFATALGAAGLLAAPAAPSAATPPASVAPGVTFASPTPSPTATTSGGAWCC